MQENNMMILGISLCQKWGKIRIFHSTIVALGEPRYIRFLFNPDKKGLVVQACARKEAECFRVLNTILRIGNLRSVVCQCYG